MKKLSLQTIILLVWSLSVNGQGAYQIWGATNSGGSGNLGIIFNTNAAGNNFHKRLEFIDRYQGAKPQGELAEYKGKFYGMANEGGSNGVGVIYEWDPATNFYTKKIDLSYAMGRNPTGGLTLNGDKFYGMTPAGGALDAGVIFEWDPETNIYIKKIDFDFATGYGPSGDLTFSNGKFYGTTLGGGAYGVGVVFEWDPVANIFTKKVDFNTTNGSQGVGSLLLEGGKLYGFTNGGGKYNFGVIFEYDPLDSNFTVKHNFNDTDGARPYFDSRLALSGDKLYGMTQSGGSTNEGVIFEWDPGTNIYTKKVDLNLSIGRYPGGVLALKNGKFYGMTAAGGLNDAGVIFEWDPASNNYIKKIDLAAVNGSSTFGSLVFKGDSFYGTTWRGGINGHGLIFAWNPQTNIFSKKIDFDYSDGSLPKGGLTYQNGKFYGIAERGGNNLSGVFFEFDPATNTYTKKIDLETANGANYVGSFSKKDGKFYGVATEGGANDGGVIFEWDPVSNIYTKKYDFIYAKGSKPWGGLTLYNDKFYGTTSRGGSNRGGVIFEWDPVKNVYTRKIELFGPDKGPEFPNGYQFSGKLALKDGKFYGATTAGGKNNSGTLFEWDPVMNLYTKKIDFDSGTVANGNLVLYSDRLYGTTMAGGANNGGFIFEWDPGTNVYAKKIDFDTAKGLAPYGSLLLSGGKFYGLTSLAGNADKGTFFEWDPVSNIYINKTEFNGANGAYPYSNYLTTAPAGVAKGSLNNCVFFPEITIDSTNNNTWVAITDTLGDIVAEIKANGNNLGLVSSSMFINSGTVREDVAKKLYLDRNITIVPETQPSSAVNIRLYIKGQEYLALKNAVNSAGVPPGIDSVNDVGIFTNNDDCSNAAQKNLVAVPTSADSWEADYVFSASISSFSSFYFAGKAVNPNVPPTVNIINPANGETFLKGATIHLRAAASDADGTISKVDFYNGTTLLATEHKVPYTFDWRIGNTGNYIITAKATDNSGSVTTSAAINISVVPNQPPTVSIISPSNGQVFTAPATINVEAAAQDADGRIVQVSFYRDSTVLTSSEHKAPYTYQWQNVPAGTYTFTAVAKDNWSAETTSAPVTITVTPSGKPLVSGRLSSADIKSEINSLPVMKLLPNPARSILNISITGLQRNMHSTISIISASGVLMKTLQTGGAAQTIPLNISSLASGVYLVKIISGDKVMYRQFVKM